MTLIVTSAAFPTIQSAINGASNGDAVLVAPGTYVENIDFVGKDITVRGAGMGLSIIDGNQAASVVTFENGETATIEGFTMRNGHGTYRSLGVGAGTWGGGVVVWGPGLVTTTGTATVRHCEITANTADGGGGVANNTATVGGGAFHFENGASATIENSIVWGNTGQPNLASTFGATMLTMTRCDVQGGYPGLGNITMDPRFVDAAGGDYHLRGDSPCRPRHRRLRG